VAVERKHSGGAQVVGNGPSPSSCRDHQSLFFSSPLLFWLSLFSTLEILPPLFCSLSVSSFFPPKGCCFFPSFSKILPPQFVPLFLKKIVPLPPGSVLSPVFIGSRGRGSPYPVHVQGMVVWELQGMVV
jgi:hypothetical protein